MIEFKFEFAALLNNQLAKLLAECFSRVLISCFSFNFLVDLSMIKTPSASLYQLGQMISLTKMRSARFCNNFK